MTRPDDPAVISALVDRLLANARTPTPKPTLRTEPRSPAKKAAAPPKPTPTPLKRAAPPTPKPTKENAMKIIPKKAAAKSRRPSRVTRPKRRGYEIAIPEELLATNTNYMPPIQSPHGPPVIRSAHDVKGATPCIMCGGECDTKQDRHGPWRRHEECSRLIAQSWLRVAPAAAHLGLGIEISDELAQMTDLYIQTYEDVGGKPTYQPDHVDRLPWGHVDRRALVKAILSAQQALGLAATPAQCEEGRCAWCGRSEAVDWQLFGHRWPDGSEAPMCGDCSDDYIEQGYPDTTYPEDARLALIAAMTGAPPMMGDEAPATLRAFHEVGEGGAGEPWDYLPAEAVERLRWSMWGRFNGKYAPDEHRAEAIARARADETDRAARVAEGEAADVFGFSSPQESDDGQ